MGVILHQLLKTLVERGGAELFITHNSPPQLRIDGALVPLDLPPLAEAEVFQLAANAFSEQFAVSLSNNDQLVHTWHVSGLARFVLRSVRDRDGRPTIIIKVVPYEILGHKELGVPDEAFINEPGLYLVGGLARSGRSTVAASIIDKHNRETHEAILVATSDPEHLHQHKNCIVTTVKASDEIVMVLDSAQTTSIFDVVVFDGRYDETIADLVLTLCDRGLRVLLVWFGRDVVALLRQFVSSFPVATHATVLTRIAEHLRWAITVTRLPHASGRGFVPIYEFLGGTREVRQMLAAGRYDNVAKILNQDDPYSPHQALLTSARLVVARKRVTKHAAEAATGLEL